MGRRATTDGADGRYMVPAVEKAVALIDSLVEARGSLTLTEICGRSGIPKSSAFAILNTLEAKGWLSRNRDGTYDLGLRLFLAGMAADPSASLRRHLRPHLEELCRLTGLTVHLAVLDHHQAVYIDKVEGKGFVQFATYVGQRLELNLSAVGKALAAFIPEGELNRIMEEKPESRRPSLSGSTQWEFTRQLEWIRANGYAVEDQEDVPGVRCVGAPVRDHSGRVVAAISVTGLVADVPSERLDELGQLVKRVADAASRDLGYAANAERRL